MTLPVLAADYDRSAISVGIAHIGVGNFHRSHQAMYLDRLLRQGRALDWGICGIGLLPADARMRDALRSQDFRYTLVEQSAEGSSSATEIGSIVDYLFAPEQLDAVLKLLATPSTRIVSLTITEGGYNISDSTGEFDAQNPEIIADIAPGARPATVFGIIVAGLRLRRERGIEPFTVMSCDNIEGNGDVTRGSIVAFARLLDPDLAEWIERTVRFPNSMVDRITPVTTPEDRNMVAERFGVRDAWPVICEDFVQWALEDDFSQGRPPWEAVGVQMVEDVRPYELMKLRLLNASHQAMAYFGLLAGYRLVHEAAVDPLIVEFLRRYMDEEATPTLAPVPGVDLDRYKETLLERFANAAVGDTLARLATDGSDRIPKWLVPVIRERRDAGLPAPLSAAVVASWARYIERHVAGDDLPFRDRQEPAAVAALERQRADRAGFLRNADWFGRLAQDAEFVRDFSATYDAAEQGRELLAGALAR
ncbi:mannitol dehydrogenase family protein [Dactylosporangium sp. CA-233914]|uniref:mannitol dehydrogenase family protein n=1 Tax=Dactylosporangium sp. CA-233914 TaxID=3239934 RepID=UPI003D93B415